jgi:hypothetical protein
MSKKKKAALVAGAVIGSTGVFFGTVLAINTLLDSQTTREYSVSEPVTELIVSSGAGNVEIVATSADRVTVHQTTHWVTSEPTPKKTLSNGVLTLADSDDCRGGWTLLRCETDYRIEVPRDLDVSVKANAGNVNVTGLAGRLTLESDAGNVKGAGLGASHVKASTDAGDVRLSFTVAPTSVDAETDAGDLDLDLPRAEYALDLDTDAGDTSVEGIVRYDLAPHSVTAETDAGDLTIRGN